MAHSDQINNGWRTESIELYGYILPVCSQSVQTMGARGRGSYVAWEWECNVLPGRTVTALVWEWYDLTYQEYDSVLPGMRVTGSPWVCSACRGVCVQPVWQYPAPLPWCRAVAGCSTGSVCAGAARSAGWRSPSGAPSWRCPVLPDGGAGARVCDGRYFCWTVWMEVMNCWEDSVCFQLSGKQKFEKKTEIGCVNSINEKTFVDCPIASYEWRRVISFLVATAPPHFAIHITYLYCVRNSWTIFCPSRVKGSYIIFHLQFMPYIAHNRNKDNPSKNPAQKMK